MFGRGKRWAAMRRTFMVGHGLAVFTGVCPDPNTPIGSLDNRAYHDQPHIPLMAKRETKRVGKPAPVIVMIQHVVRAYGIGQEEFLVCIVEEIYHGAG